ncbi:unnamed protein product [Rhizopus stolonifer]
MRIVEGTTILSPRLPPTGEVGAGTRRTTVRRWSNCGCDSLRRLRAEKKKKDISLLNSFTLATFLLLKMVNLDRYITVPNKSNLLFFSNHKISEWDFETYKSYNIQQKGPSSDTNSLYKHYNQSLNNISTSLSDKEIKNYLKTLVVKPISNKQGNQKSQSEPLHITIQDSFNNSKIGNVNLGNRTTHIRKRSFDSAEQGGTTFVADNATTADTTTTNTTSTSSSSTTTYDTVVDQSVTALVPNKRVKPTYYYLEGRPVVDEFILEEIKWFVRDHDVSKKLLYFREKCKEEGAKGEKLQNSIEELAINSIFFISLKNSKYTGISESINEAMVEELEKKYDVGEELDLEEIEKFEVEELRKIYKLAKKNVAKAKRMANNLMFDEEGVKECMCQAIINFLNENGSSTSPRCKEDLFTKKFVTPLFSPFLKESKYLKQFGNDEESEGSKERRGARGRISDGGIKVMYKEHEQQLLHLEIKSPYVVPEGQIHHPDFTKLGNLMKDEVDLMLKKDFPEDTPVFGILVGGHHARVFAMDLVYTKIYRLFEIGSFLLPQNPRDLNRLDDVFDTMAQLNVLKTTTLCQVFYFTKKAIK